jgi:hypothetical protein
MKDINQRTHRHIDQVRGLTEQTQIASREIRSSFGDSEKAIRDLIEEQKATKKQLAETQKQLSETIEASAKQTATLEQKLDQMQAILKKLAKDLEPQTAEPAALESVRTQLGLAQQEAKLLKQQKVGGSVDLGTGRKRSSPNEPAVQEASSPTHPPAWPAAPQQRTWPAQRTSSTGPGSCFPASKTWHRPQTPCGAASTGLQVPTP